MDEPNKFIMQNNLIRENDYIIVGVSGGPDSMALLHFLISLRKNISFNIVCAHVNHNVREESKSEKELVNNYCKENNIIFEYMKIKEYSNSNFEMEARDKRYAFFSKLIKKYNSKLLFIAHHGDDLIETILMRLVRGSTLKGYAGFSKIIDMDTYKIVRPLVFYTKDDILNYVKKYNIPYSIDITNLEDEHTRNRYRHNVLPFLKEEDKNVHLKFLKFSETILEYSKYVDKEAVKKKNNIYKNNTLNITKFLKLEFIIQKRIIYLILESIYNKKLLLINDRHFNNIYNLINSNRPNSRIKLPSNILVIKKYDELSFINEDSKVTNYEIILDKNVNLPNDRVITFVDKEDSDSNYVCRLNSSELNLPLYVRTKKNGDKMYVKHLLGSKKIKDIFINSKIPLKDRNTWPIVVDKLGNILWLPGLKKSKYNKEKNEKYDIILRYN